MPWHNLAKPVDPDDLAFLMYTSGTTGKPTVVGYTAKDISEVLACSASTARVYLFNARRKIKTLLENDHGLLQNG